MNNAQSAAGIVAIGLALLVVVQFVPNGGGIYRTTIFGADQDYEIAAYPWGVETEARTTFGDSSDSQTWQEYFEDNGDDGQRAMETAMIMHYVGAGMALLGALLGALGGRSFHVLSLIGGAALAVALVLFATGFEDAFDGELPLAAGFFLGAIAALLTIGGGVSAFGRPS